MRRNWFRPYGWFFVPISLPAWILCLMAALFCLQVFTALDRHSHSASDTLFGVFPFFASTFLLLDWVARRTSSGRLMKRQS